MPTNQDGRHYEKVYPLIRFCNPVGFRSWKWSDKLDTPHPAVQVTIAGSRVVLQRHADHTAQEGSVAYDRHLIVLSS
jgi:hypothetical protein